uniref:Uncharacterized protein n=1 Tax=Solanum lycopersicum TaxID=4081 RepID=A0A3Q7EDD3_SOLLC
MSHFLIALFPGQVQINSYLQFSKQFINLRIGVTLTTSLSTFMAKKINIPYSLFWIQHAIDFDV